ncbi:MAG: alcohol dehydrogenase catalytic domain-containing protein [bacterium]
MPLRFILLSAGLITGIAGIHDWRRHEAQVFFSPNFFLPGQLRMLAYLIASNHAQLSIEAGNQVRDLHAGDHVAVDPNIAFGSCYYCRRGQVNFCENLPALGVDIELDFEAIYFSPRG